MKQAVILFFISVTSWAAWSAGVGFDFSEGEGGWIDGGEPIVRMDSVVVRGRLTREIIPGQVLDGERLVRLETHSVADAIRYFSGVQIKDYGGVGGLRTVNVRSLGSSHTGVFYDGMPVGNAQNGVVDLGRFSLDNVEAVTLHNGQKSDIFQSARDFSSAAAVYIQTRRPVFETGRKNNIKARLAGGSFDLVDGSVLWERRLGKRLGASANLQALNSSGRYKYYYERPGGGWDTTAVRRNGDVRIVKAEAGLFGEFASEGSGRWRLKAYYYDSDRGLPGAVIKEDYAISLRNEDRQRDRNFFVQGSVEQQVSPLYSYRLQAKYAYDHTNYIMPPEASRQSMDTHYRQGEAYVSLANLFSPTPWLSADVSLDGQFNTLDADVTALFERNFPQPRRLTLLGAAALSVRLQKFSAQGSLLYTYAHDSSAKGRRMADDRNIFTPSVILDYRPWGGIDLDIRAFYKEVFRLPTFNDLYYIQIGTRTLKPEYTRQYDLGATWRHTRNGGMLASLGVSLDGYYNEVRDKIVASPTGNQFVWAMTNIGHVEVRGVDAAADIELRLGGREQAPRLSGRMSYTFQDTSGGDPVPYAPRHSASAVAGLTWGGKKGRWAVDYSFIYTGERYDLGSHTPVNLLQPWYTHDVALSRDFTLKHATLRLGLEVNNIFDQRYEVVKWYPMPGTNVKLLISITL